MMEKIIDELKIRKIEHKTDEPAIIEFLGESTLHYPKNSCRPSLISCSDSDKTSRCRSALADG